MRKHAGFTLLEVMVVVVIISILATIGYPAYTDYVRRGKIAEALSELANHRTRMEQFFLDNRSYQPTPAAGTNCGVAPPAAPAVKYFTYTCAAPDANTYTVTATGVAGEGMGPFVYTINQQNTRTSTVTSLSGWSGSATCWVTKKGGVC